MIVLIDAGNSNIKLASVSNVGDIERITINQFYESISLVKKVIYASVNHSKSLQQILTECQKNQIELQEVITSKTFKNIHCGYENSQNLGVDRWLAIIGARTAYKDDTLIIVDAGTAITIDVCNKEQHLGGWIVPGLTLMQHSIIEKAPGVFSDQQIKNERLGSDTPSALFHGCLYSSIGLIEKANDFAKEKSKSTSKIILTGGDAKLLSEYLTLPNDVNSDLVFMGLKQFIE